MTIILAQGVGSLTGWDWLWIFFAVMIDVMHYSSTAYSNRNQIPGYKPVSTTPATPPPPSQPMVGRAYLLTPALAGLLTEPIRDIIDGRVPSACAW